MYLKIKYYVVSAIICLMTTKIVANDSINVPVSYKDYINIVASDNIQYAAEKLKVSVAKAEELAAKTFNDPTLSVSYYNNENNTLQMGEGVEVELSRTFTFGKRKANIALARSEVEQSKAMAEDFFRQLRASATVAFLDALRATELLEVKRQTLQNLKQLASSDSLRCKVGEIGEVDASQSRLEANMAYNDFVAAEAEWRNSLSAMNVIMGHSSDNDIVYYPKGSLQSVEPRDYNLSELLSCADINRADIVASNLGRDVARKALTVTRRERRTDIDLSITVSHNGRVHNEEAPAPTYTGVTFGVAIPLKFSNINKGAVRAAKYRTEQADTEHKQALLQMHGEISDAYRVYLSQRKQCDNYEKDMLQKAGEVLKGRLYSYGRGAVSLLEALTAQRTYSEVKEGYIEALYNHAVALVNLNASAGIWDVTLP